MTGGGLKVEGDVGAAFTAKGLEVQRGGGADEGGSVPEVSFRKHSRKKLGFSHCTAVSSSSCHD